MKDRAVLRAIFGPLPLLGLALLSVGLAPLDGLLAACRQIQAGSAACGLVLLIFVVGRSSCR
jgi:hypothetical protein